MRRASLAVLSFAMSSVLVVVALVAPAWIVGPADAAGRRAPHLSDTIGPLEPARVTLVGRGLDVARKVRFGAQVATKLHHRGARAITVSTPRRTKPGTVAVTVKVGERWLRAGHYRFVARPVLRGMSTTSGGLMGGESVRMTGTALAPRPTVTFGDAVAEVTRTGAGTLDVTVPPGLEGAAPVRVRTPGGTSDVLSYTYVAPDPVSDSTYSPLGTTAVVPVDQVQWVAGGPQPSDPAGSAYEPWVVSLAPGAPAPEVGQGYFLAPGGDALPSGLTGVVRSIAGQIDGTTRVTVDPAPIAETMRSASVAFSSGDEPGRGGAGRTTGEVEQDFAGSASYSNLGASAFNCTNDLGREVSFSGSLSVEFTRLHPNIFFVATPQPNYSAYVTGTVVVTGKITASSSIECKLDPLWANAHRKVIPIGSTGATISFGPTAKIELSVAGTFEVKQTTRFMYGVAKYDDDPIEWIHIAKNLDPEVSVNAELSLTASAGVSIQVGLLDRIGAELKGQVYLSGSVSAPIVSTNPRSCVRVDWGFSIGVDAFLDLFVARWESPSRTFKLGFDLYEQCLPPPGSAEPSGDPIISSSVLPDATASEYYDEWLGTRDGRSGVWSIASGALPAGLRLESDGEIDGTPASGAVGSYQPTVRFVDSAGRSAESMVKITVQPGSGLGGGDMQATLTWSGEADLDLHALEPDDNEIYYGNRGPSWNGGELDWDSNAACDFVDDAPAENIHWPDRSASSGYYYVWVETYATCGSSDLDWHLVVRIQGRVVIDETGYDGSDWYEIYYPGGSARPRVREVAPLEGVSSPERSRKG
jgi:hypothetical protein